jgi:hypothetical protein
MDPLNKFCAAGLGGYGPCSGEAGSGFWSLRQELEIHRYGSRTSDDHT